MPWLEKRKKKLGAEEINRLSDDKFFVGGQVKLEGAPYFWFFAKLMLGTALVYLVFARFYKTKEYFHDDEPLVEDVEPESDEGEQRAPAAN